MRDWLTSHKPAVSARVHLLLAAALWTVVGGLLLAFGAKWLLAWRSTYVWLVAPVAVTVGLLKGRVVLERSAVRIIERIRERGDDRCVGGFLSPKTWLLVLLMMVSGRVLRAALLPTPMVGFLYAAIGVALLWASRRLWGACQRPGAAS